jgi:GT2 family glycosyltransferase
VRDVYLIVPRHPDGDGPRDRAWEWCRARWRHNHPPLRIVEATTEPWSKARAVNAAVARLRRPPAVLVVADADVFIDPIAITRAISSARRVGWAVPHGLVYRLDENATAAALASSPGAWTPDEARAQVTRAPYLGLAAGGIVVVTAASWATVGGFDPRFVTWGGEDVSLGWALRTLVGPGLRIGLPLWHLDHPPTHRYNRPEYVDTLALQERYRRADGDPAAMRALIDEREMLGYPPRA